MPRNGSARFVRPRNVDKNGERRCNQSLATKLRSDEREPSTCRYMGGGCSLVINAATPKMIVRMSDGYLMRGASRRMRQRPHLGIPPVPFDKSPPSSLIPWLAAPSTRIAATCQRANTCCRRQRPREAHSLDQLSGLSLSGSDQAVDAIQDAVESEFNVIDR